MASILIPRPEAKPARVVKPSLGYQRPTPKTVNPQPGAGAVGAGQTQFHPGHPSGTGKLLAGQLPPAGQTGAAGAILAGQLPTAGQSGSVGDVAAGQHPGAGPPAGVGDVQAGQQPKIPGVGSVGNILAGQLPKGHV